MLMPLESVGVFLVGRGLSYEEYRRRHAIGLQANLHALLPEFWTGSAGLDVDFTDRSFESQESPSQPRSNLDPHCFAKTAQLFRERTHCMFESSMHQRGERQNYSCKIENIRKFKCKIFKTYTKSLHPHHNLSTLPFPIWNQWEIWIKNVNFNSLDSTLSY